MEKRRLGRTEHQSSVAIFGTAAFYQISREDADRTMDFVLTTEINHIDVAPGYGDAEDRLGPWMVRERKRYFLGCKTEKRSKEDAAKELRISLKKLQIDQFDLYQLHAVATMADLDRVMSKDGALESILIAQQEGLLRYIGITSHGLDTPLILLEALRRFNFDTVMFPLNPNLMGVTEYKNNTDKLLLQCKKLDVGVMIIKSISKGAWDEKEKTNTTWYEPFDSGQEIQNGIDFALTHDVTGICTAADVHLLPKVVQACEQFAPMSVELQAEMIRSARSQSSIFKVEQ
jgi:predicted aldo/keto reductase-like oxidoreductase